MNLFFRNTNQQTTRRMGLMAVLAMLAVSYFTSLSYGDITIDLVAKDTATAVIDIDQPGESTTITLVAPDGYEIHDSKFVVGQGASDPDAYGPEDQAATQDYEFTIALEGLSSGTAAKYSGHLIPVGGHGHGPVELVPFDAEVTQPFEVTLDISDEAVKAGEHVTLTGKLTTQNGGGDLSGKTITFTAEKRIDSNDAWVDAGWDDVSATTDAQGEGTTDSPELERVADQCTHNFAIFDKVESGGMAWKPTIWIFADAS